MKCQNCNKEGHLKRQCPKRNQGKKSKDGDNGNATIVEDGYDNANVLVVATKGIEKCWILDSGCSFHVSPNKDWLEELK